MKTKEVIDAIFRDINKMPLFLLNAVSVPFEAKIKPEIGLYIPFMPIYLGSNPIPLLRFYEI